MFAAGQFRFTRETVSLTQSHTFRAFLAALRHREWIVYAKTPFGGPEQVLAYLGRYTHWIAIANERLLDCEWRGLLPLPRLCAREQGEGDAPPGRGMDLRLPWRIPFGRSTRPVLLPAKRLSDGFCCTSSPRASSASAITGSSPTATAPNSSPPAGPRSMSRLPHRAQQKPSKRSSSESSGPIPTAAPTVVKDGSVHFAPSRPSLGPPDHRSCDGPPESCTSPLRRSGMQPPQAPLRPSAH